MHSIIICTNRRNNPIRSFKSISDLKTLVVELRFVNPDPSVTQDVEFNMTIWLKYLTLF